MNDTFKHIMDGLAAGVVAAGTVLDHVVTIVAGCMSIAWYTYRFIEARKAKNVHVG